MATGSNVQSVVDQYRQSYQASATVDGLLKDVYLDLLNDTTFGSTPLLAMFGDFGGEINFAANKIIKAFKSQGAGGFGAISEGGDFVKSRFQKGFQGSTRIKFLNAYFSLTGPAARTVKKGVGGYVDAVSSSMEDTLTWAKLNMERMCGGRGDGECARFTNGATNETAIASGEYFMTIAGASSSTYSAAKNLLTGLAAAGGYSKVSWLQPGARVQLILTSELDGTVPSTDIYGPFEVVNVDYEADTFALIYRGTSTANISDLASADVSVTLEGAYGEIEADGTVTSDQCLELNGLYNLISDGVDHSGVGSGGNLDESLDKYAKIWGKERADYAFALRSTVKANADGTELDEELLMRWVLDMANIKQTVPNALVTDPRSRLKYFSNRKEDRRFSQTEIDTVFGFKSIGVTIDNYTLMLQSLASLTPGTLMLLNVNDFKYAKATSGFEWIEDGGRILRNKDSSDNLYGTAVNYCEFVCENPKGQLKATNLSYD